MKVEIKVGKEVAEFELDEQGQRITDNLSNLQGCSMTEALSRYLQDYLNVVGKHEDLIYQKIFSSVDKSSIN